MAATDILEGTGGDWDIGLPSRGPPVGSGVTAGPAYYAWPSWLVTDANSGIATPAELDGATICGVSGTAGLDWLRGESASEDARIEPPTGVTALERTNDADCVEAVLSGQAAAAVTAQLLDDELAGEGLRALIEDPVLQERRVIVARGSGSDVETMLDGPRPDLARRSNVAGSIGCFAPSIRGSGPDRGYSVTAGLRRLPAVALVALVLACEAAPTPTAAPTTAALGSRLEDA